MIVNADLRAAECIKRLHGIQYPMVAEIGCYKGDLSRRLLYRTNLHLLMVDPWGSVEASEAYKATDDPMAYMTDEDWAVVMETALKSVSWAADRVRVYHGTSEGAAAHFNERFDLVFIDGDHSYEATKQDIALWLPKVADGGWLGGHDYRDDKNFGVIQAVSESFGEIELGENHTWWFRC